MSEFWKNLGAPMIGLMGTLLTLGVTLWKERRSTLKANRELESALKRMSFWKDWIAAASPLVEEAQLNRAREALQELASEMSRLSQRTVGLETSRRYMEYKNYREKVPGWRRALLLYFPGTLLGWWGKSTFWWIALFVLPEVLYKYSLQHGLRALTVLIIFASIGGMYVLRELVCWLEAPHGRRAQGSLFW